MEVCSRLSEAARKLFHIVEATYPACANGAPAVLLEDERPLLAFFSTVLRRDGFNVLEAGNGSEDW